MTTVKKTTKPLYYEPTSTIPYKGEVNNGHSKTDPTQYKSMRQLLVKLNQSDLIPLPGTPKPYHDDFEIPIENMDYDELQIFIQSTEHDLQDAYQKRKAIADKQFEEQRQLALDQEVQKRAEALLKEQTK